MQYYRPPFPKSCPLLLGAAAVRTYLRAYAESVRNLVRFRSEVIGVRPLERSNSICGAWEVQVLDVASNTSSWEAFDALVVANGRYNKEHVLEIFGLDEWGAASPDDVLHSKYYRVTESFRNKVSKSQWAFVLCICDNILNAA